MSLEEVTKTVRKFGYELYDHLEDSDGYLYSQGYNQLPLYFKILPETGLIQKTMHMDEEVEGGMGIDELMEKHKIQYLSLTGIDFYEYMPKPEVDSHRAIFFNKDEYSGDIQFNIKNDKAIGYYSLAKIPRN